MGNKGTENADRNIMETEQLLRNTNKSIPEPNIKEANKSIGVVLRKYGIGSTTDEPSKPYARRRTNGRNRRDTE